MLPDALTTSRTDNRLRPAEVVFTPGEPGGTLTVAPGFADLFTSVGLTTASSFLQLPGEVVSGHPDRHVARVELPGFGRAFYLKRQHVVGWREKWRNRRLGFGWVSRCEREATVLQQLEAAGLPAPRWAAFGAHDGRVFLLVEEVPGIELRKLLIDNMLSLPERRRAAANVGRAAAAIHAAGFTTPDLTAKHVFVHPESLAVTFIDWQSTERRPVTDADRADALGALHASLAGVLASRAERSRALAAFRPSPLAGEGGGRSGPPGEGALASADPRSSSEVPTLPLPRPRRLGHPLPQGERGAKKLLLPLILRAAERHAQRRSVRDQLQPAADPQRLVWLAGEAVCAVPEMAAVWPQPAVCAPFYDIGPDGAMSVRFAGREAVLVRGHSVSPLGRLRAWLRATPWRSPGVTVGRVLFHLQRYGVPAPKLLAFGQRFTSAVGADWFALYDAPPGVPFRRWQRTACVSERTKLFDALSACLGKLHDAGCVLIDVRAAFAVNGGGVTVADPLAVRIVRRVTEAARLRDRRALARLMGVE